MPDSPGAMASANEELRLDSQCQPRPVHPGKANHRNEPNFRLTFDQHRKSLPIQMYRLYTSGNLLDIPAGTGVACASIQGTAGGGTMKWGLYARLVLAAMLMLAATSLAAQIFPGRITGTVRDAQAAVVPGANVKLTNTATGLERTATTSDNGEFNFPQLALGTYQLTVSKSGFQTVVLTDITTSLTQVNTLSPVLKVGTVTSEVEVMSIPPLIQTETNSAGGQLSEVQVSSLPIGNSDYTRLALVLPGSVQNSNFAFAQYSINGSRARSAV